MKDPNSRNLPSLNKEEQGGIHAMAEQMAEQIRQAVASSLGEMLCLIQENRRQPAMDAPSAARPDEFLRASDVAKELKIRKSLAYQMIKTREIPTFSFGRTVRIRREDLDAFLRAHTVR